MIYAKEGVTALNYVSYFCSRYHPWFVELGYPQLDINEYPDGEWEIIEYHRSPVVPAETPFQVVLRGMRNISITKSFIEKYVAQIDPRKAAFWERENGKTKVVLAEAEARERNALELSERATKAITQNPDLMNRIAKNGLGEMDVDQIRRHIPRSRIQ